MRVEINETTLRKMNMDRSVISEKIMETYVIYPDKDKKLRNKKTGYTTESFVGLSSISQIADYEEI